MTARPFTPEMGRARRPVHGGWHAAGLALALVAAAWAGAHGLGPLIGLAALVVIVAASTVVAVRFVRWAVREIRTEVEAGRGR